MNIKRSALILSVALLSVVDVVGTKNLCSNNRHVTGAWKHRESLAKGNKSFHCCGWDNSDFLHDKALCGPDKITGINDLYAGNDVYATQVGGNACDCDKGLDGRYSVTPREQYEWVPEFCYLLPWNATQFCELLGSRSILMSGDSTMQQTASTLMSMVTTGGGKCAHQIVLGRSDLLFYSAHGHNNFFQYVEKVLPDIAIATVGAHLDDLGDIYSVWENIKNKMPELRTISPKTKFVWKTQNPGHVDCHEFHEPVDKIPEIDPSLDFYHYNLLHQFDAISLNYTSMLNFKVIDMTPLYYRPDAHADCMHYCVPGPLDIFSNILLGMLFNKEL